MRQRLNLTSETEIVDTIVSWDAKLLERPPLIEITGETAPRMTPYFPQTPEGHRLMSYRRILVTRGQAAAV